MESVLHQCPILSCSILTARPYASPPKIFLPSAIRKPPSIRCSSREPAKTSESLASNLKPCIISLAASAAAFVALSLGRRAFAFAAAPLAPPTPVADTQPLSPESEALTDVEKERSLESHLASLPDDVSALRDLMELKVKLRKLPEAIAVSDRLILLEPREKDLPLLRSHLLCYNGESEAAKRGFEAVLDEDPFVVEAYHGLVIAASNDDAALGAVLNRVEEMMETCEKAGRKKELRDFKMLLAQVRVIEGDYEEALKLYNELVKEEPRDFRPYLCLGIIYTLLRKKDEAVKQFDKYKKLVPKGHPYARYFEENMAAMTALAESRIS